MSSSITLFYTHARNRCVFEATEYQGPSLLFMKTSITLGRGSPQDPHPSLCLYCFQGSNYTGRQCNFIPSCNCCGTASAGPVTVY